MVTQFVGLFGRFARWWGDGDVDGGHFAQGVERGRDLGLVAYYDDCLVWRDRRTCWLRGRRRRR